MLRTLLVGLDGSKDSVQALELAIRWARRMAAMVVGVGIIDEPAIRAAVPAKPVGGKPGRDAVWSLGYQQHLDDARRHVEQFLQQCAVKCAEASVACKLLEDEGIPPEQIRREAERFDLIMLGRQSHFRFETKPGPDDTLRKVLRDTPRPVVAVPERVCAGDSVVVAYDGSLPAARALFAFEASGLGKGVEIHVVTVDTDQKDASQCAERAIAFLEGHELHATPHVVCSNRATIDELLERVEQLGPGLLVLGSYGKPMFQQFLLGSVSRKLLAECHVPMFFFH